MSGMRLRPATLSDVALLQRWDAQPHVIESDPEGDPDWDWAAEIRRDPPWRAQLLGEIDGRAVGCVQIIDPAREDDHYWGDCGPGLRAIDIWIGDATDLGRGWGTQMMRLAIERCFSAPDVQAILIDPLRSNTRAQAFYQRMGFSFVEHRWFDTDECAVHQLTRADWTGPASS